jgi:hypothetical protein
MKNEQNMREGEHKKNAREREREREKGARK